MEAKSVKSVKLCGRSSGIHRVPELRLSGLWLDKLGFDIGRTVEITSSKKKLVIRAGKNEYKRTVRR